jgi:hypothetical protein
LFARVIWWFAVRLMIGASCFAMPGWAGPDAAVLRVFRSEPRRDQPGISCRLGLPYHMALPDIFRFRN